MIHTKALLGLDIEALITTSLVLFAVIDPIGNIPNVIHLRQKAGRIAPGQAALAAWLVMIIFLFVGQQLLAWFHIDTGSFSVAGSIILLAIGLEMVFNITLFKIDTFNLAHASIVPLAFPMVAGTGTLTTLLALRADYSLPNIALGVTVNSFIFYLAARYAGWIERTLGALGTTFVRKIMGTLLMAIAIKAFRIHFFAPI